MYFKRKLKRSQQQCNIHNLLKKQIIIDSIVELVDIFPTIADLANISIPICLNEKNFLRAETICSEGISLVPLVKAALNEEVIVIKTQCSLTLILHSDVYLSNQIPYYK